ncbi:MAG: hypothetical protein QNI84_11425 [Henriciella sp.]|nr:hypothetical protein [Henriciella sp.]
MRIFWRLFAGAGLAAYLILPAQAQLRLSDFFIDLYPGATSGEIYAANEGSDPLYLKVTAEEVIDPGLETESVRDVVDPRELGLLVSPQRLIVNEGEEKRIRLVALEQPEADRFYKVTVTPVVGEIESDEMIGVKLMIAYAAWVFVRPEDGAPALTARREDGALIVKNDGTTHAELTGGKQCASADRDSCEKIDRFRVLAGREKRIDLPMPENAAPIEFNVLYASEVEKVAF